MAPGQDVEKLAEQGLVSIVCCNSPAYVSAGRGSARRVFGTNPMAFGWPRPGGSAPYVWDQAPAVMSRGELQPSGRDSADPAAILSGAQLPFGLHKGANISATIELLSAALFGGSDLAVDNADSTAFHDVRRRGD